MTMARLGRLTVWIVMLSLPLQGLSAVSLRGCATVMQVQLDKAAYGGCGLSPGPQVTPALPRPPCERIRRW